MTIEIKENKPGKRFADALGIQAGACNPSGIARSLVQACEECIRGAVTQTADPAIRLMVHQLAYICAVDAINDSPTLYHELTEACRKESGNVAG
jgi:hypothetical protein